MTLRATARRSLALLVAVGALVAACGNDDNEPRSWFLSSDGRPGPTDAERSAARASAVSVRATGCAQVSDYGTGAVVDDRLVITAAHVVAGADSVSVEGVASPRIDAEVVHFDPELDLALLRLDGPVGPPLQLRRAEARAGEVGVAVVARRSADSPDDWDPIVVEVAVVRTVNISTTDIWREGDVDRAGFEVAGPIEPGDSGAVVVLGDGGVGLIWARSNLADDRAWAIDLPESVLDPAARAALDTSTDTGRCVG